MKNVSLITVINSNPYSLFRPKGKINEGKKPTAKAEGTLDFYHLGPYRIYDTYPINGRLDGIYGVFYGLN